MMIKAELQKKLPHPNISHSAQMLQLMHLHTMLPYGIPINVMMNAQPWSHSDRDNMIRINAERAPSVDCPDTDDKTVMKLHKEQRKLCYL
ncbi:hypothetical protein L1987_21483 [Smallanthus sonchifolius]|uniref:Uncharacterized protein n=1 Tax=Smallanthus sonchifolius TaxID=185202 RepID=A0ACB9IUP8_9ASTR|nr:hypothetical protein L1987_21483 [Smallanthus sonchifolius]